MEWEAVPKRGKSACTLDLKKKVFNHANVIAK